MYYFLGEEILKTRWGASVTGSSLRFWEAHGHVTARHRFPWEGRLLFEAIKKRTRLGPLDDQAPSYEVLLRTVGGWFAQDRLSQIRSSALRNSPSLRGLASFRFQKTLPIHQICRPAKARATRPSWRYPQFSFSISPLRSPVPRSVPKSA